MGTHLTGFDCSDNVTWVSHLWEKHWLVTMWSLDTDACVNKHMCLPFWGDREGPFCLTHWWAQGSRKLSVMSQWGGTGGVLQLANVNIKRQLQIRVKWNGSIVADREVKLCLCFIFAWYPSCTCITLNFRLSPTVFLFVGPVNFQHIYL